MQLAVAIHPQTSGGILADFWIKIHAPFFRPQIFIDVKKCLTRLKNFPSEILTLLRYKNIGAARRFKLTDKERRINFEKYTDGDETD